MKIQLSKLVTVPWSHLTTPRPWREVPKLLWESAPYFVLACAGVSFAVVYVDILLVLFGIAISEGYGLVFYAVTFLSFPAVAVSGVLTIVAGSRYFLVKKNNAVKPLKFTLLGISTLFFFFTAIPGILVMAVG